MTPVDLRNETFQRFGPTAARFGPEPQVPSPNLKAIRDSLAKGSLAPLKTLAEKIEAGNATSTEEEQEQVYDAVPLLMAHVLDLLDMCERRERALAECDVGVGRKAA